MAVDTCPEEWGSIQRAARVAGVSEYRVRSLIKAGRVSTRSIPGARAEVSLREVIAVARASVVPASVTSNVLAMA